MRLLAKIAALSAVAAVGVLLAASLPAQGRGLATTTDTTTTDAAGQTTTHVSTVEATTTLVTTLEQTTTHQIIVPTLPTTTEPVTTEASSSDNGTAAWIWVLLAILGVGLIVLAIILARRGSGQTVSPEERRRRLDNAVGSWVAQGWAIESQDAESAVLRRVDDLVLVHVDAAGHVSARPFGSS